MLKLETDKLWLKVESFSLDSNEGNYPFSRRLSYENSWTKHFTEQAILEYKKFMFLAAVTDKMVSPSKIVDTVWHLHLIYTESYSKFCLLLGKEINHIPGNHSKGEVQKFRNAQKFTQNQYENHFGTPPKDYWINTNIRESLNLTPLKFNALQVSYFLIPFVTVVTIIFGIFIVPYYAKITNEIFYPSLIGLSVLAFGGLERLNNDALETFILKRKNTILGHLTISELIFYKTMKIKDVIHGYVNHLVESNVIEISPNYILKKQKGLPQNASLEEKIILNELGKDETYYSRSIKKLTQEKVFLTIESSVKEIHRSILYSREFFEVYILNISIFSVLLTISSSRIVTGVIRSKPIVFAVIFNIILFLLIVFYLLGLTRKLGKCVLPKLLKQKQITSYSHNLQTWDWKYYVSGAVIFTAGFSKIHDYLEKNKHTGNTECGTNCSSDCSSCSSCGGCGGD